MEISAYLHKFADQNIPRKQQSIVKAFAKALEIIPRQLCDNAGFDATNILTQLRVEHRKGNTWAGVDFDNEGVRDNMKAFVWEPSLVKVNAVQAAVEASCLILSVDETISMHPPTTRPFPSFPFATLHPPPPFSGSICANIFPNRERTISRPASASARPSSRRSSTSASRPRKRNAQKMRQFDPIHLIPISKLSPLADCIMRIEVYQN